MLIKSTDAMPCLTHKQIERPVSAQGTCIYMYHVHACIHKCVYLSAQTVLGWHKWRMLKLQVYIYRIGKVINNLKGKQGFEVDFFKKCMPGLRA